MDQSAIFQTVISSLIALLPTGIAAWKIATAFATRLALVEQKQHVADKHFDDHLVDAKKLTSDIDSFEKYLENRLAAESKKIEERLQLGERRFEQINHNLALFDRDIALLKSELQSYAKNMETLTKAIEKRAEKSEEAIEMMKQFVTRHDLCPFNKKSVSQIRKMLRIDTPDDVV